MLHWEYFVKADGMMSRHTQQPTTRTTQKVLGDYDLIFRNLLRLMIRYIGSNFPNLINTPVNPLLGGPTTISNRGCNLSCYRSEFGWSFEMALCDYFEIVITVTIDIMSGQRISFKQRSPLQDFGTLIG